MKYLVSIVVAMILTVLVPSAILAKDPATIIKNRAALERLLGNSGISLQWMSWVERGYVKMEWRGKALHIEAEQRDPATEARVRVDGRVVSIDQNAFILKGTIEIRGTPDIERRCQSEGEWRFAITQNRKYWRLRQFEWCDELTDYIDIYF